MALEQEVARAVLQGHITRKAISAAIASHPETVRNAIIRMVAKGLLLQTNHGSTPEGRRPSTYALTEKGRALLPAAELKEAPAEDEQAWSPAQELQVVEAVWDDALTFVELWNATLKIPRHLLVRIVDELVVRGELEEKETGRGAQRETRYRIARKKP